MTVRVVVKGRTSGVLRTEFSGAGQKRGLGKAVEMWYTGGELLGKSVFAGTDYTYSGVIAALSRRNSRTVTEF